MCTQFYFDYAATTPVKEKVLKEMLPYFNTNFGNPSSIYKIGRQSRADLILLEIGSQNIKFKIQRNFLQVEGPRLIIGL